MSKSPDLTSEQSANIALAGVIVMCAAAFAAWGPEIGIFVFGGAVWASHQVRRIVRALERLPRAGFLGAPADSGDKPTS
jgi:hypothetical protein